MSAKVDANEHVSSNHAAALQKDYKDAGKILEDAAEDVEDAETFEELREIVPEVFLETLVFALLAPKTGLVLGSHTMVAATDRMEDFADKLEEIIGFLAARGYDMTAAQAALEDMSDSVSSAEALAAPVADSVIDLDQDDWEEPAKTTLEQGKNDLQGAREALREAHGHAQATVQAIREALSS